MSFTTLPLAAVLFGLAALAAVLFLLQRLRVRHRDVEVVTTLFWREAVEEAHARVFVQRFRHPLAYLLAFAIAALIWLALAGPRESVATHPDHVVLLDRSAGMARPGRWEAALEVLAAEVGRLPRSTTSVIDCGPAPRALLLPGEEALLLEHRLAGLAPAACPPTLEAELLRVAAVSARTSAPELVVVGDAPLASDALALLPEGVRVRRAGVPAELTSNRGITALGVAPARSGVWDQVDVLVEVRGAGEPELAFALDGEPLAASAERTGALRADTPGLSRFVLEGLAAEGRALSVSLVGADALALDDAAAIRLPERRRIRVLLSPALEPVLGAVLALDPAVRLVDEGAVFDVAIRLAGEALGKGAPALELVAADAQEAAFLVVHEEEDGSGDVLAAALTRLGLGDVDATSLATEASRPITLAAEVGERRSVRVWTELFGPDYDFTSSRAFPLFVAGTVRWLAEPATIVPFVAAGEPARDLDRGSFASSEGVPLDPVGAAFTPPVAGEYADASGSSLSAALLAPDVSMGESGGEDASEPARARAEGFGATTWLLLAALVLLCVEWLLYRSGRMP